MTDFIDAPIHKQSKSYRQGSAPWQVESAIHLVTGKGGVGKSLFSHWLAYKLSQTGTKTLLAELGETGHLTTKKTQMAPDLWAIRWTAQNCLKEYFAHYLPSQKLVDLFFENKVTKTLVGAAPGLRELALLGKVTSGPREVGPKMLEKTVVVDAFATGHFLALLRAPVGLSRIIPIGPMGTQTQSMIKTMADPTKTTVWVVTRPEELALTEALELVETLRSEFNLSPRIVLSGGFLAQEEFPAKEDPNGFLSFMKEWNDRTLRAIETLKASGVDFYMLPFVFKRSFPEIVQGLLKGAL